MLLESLRKIKECEKYEGLEFLKQRIFSEIRRIEEKEANLTKGEGYDE